MSTHIWRNERSHACAIEPGPGRIVLSTVRHSSAALMRIEFVGSDSPLRLTPEHRLYSEDRDGWTPAGDLRPGEFVRTVGGPPQVATIAPVPDRHEVYNLEVETTHCYYAGDPGVLSHNAAACVRMVTVSRWGRPGLQPGDWVMRGPMSWRNYILSGKWQWWNSRWFGTNQYAAYSSGTEYVVLSNELHWPHEGKPLLDWLKWLIGQRIYDP